MLWEAVVKIPLLPPLSAAATVNNTTISTIGSIPPLLPSMMTAIAAVDYRHRRCHTVVDNNDRQKPAVIIHR